MRGVHSCSLWENYVGTSEIPQRLKRPHKHDDLNSVSRSSYKEERIDSKELSSDLHRHTEAYVATYTYHIYI